MKGRIVKKKDNQTIDVLEESLVELPKARICALNINGMKHILCTRSSGDFKNHAFYLSSDFKWEMVTDNEGDLILIPIRKDINK